LERQLLHKEELTVKHSRTNGLAIASFILGVVGIIPWLVLLAAYFLGESLYTIVGNVIGLRCILIPLFELAGIIVGAVALFKLKRLGFQEKGKGLAIAGIVLGGLGLALSPFIAFNFF
jgi:hypothetical protein